MQYNTLLRCVIIMLGNSKLKIRIKDNSFIVFKKENPYWRAFYANGYGELRNDYLVLSPIEALYLIESNKGIILTQRNEEIKLFEACKLISKQEESIWRLYLVYRDIRDRGYIVKTMDDYLTPFEIFERGKDPLQNDSFAFILVAESGKEIHLEELSRALEKAKKSNKLLIVALIDELGDITYYQIDETLVRETILKIYRKTRT